MLSMLLLLAVSPQVAEAPAHDLRPATINEMMAAGVPPPPGYSSTPGVIGMTPAHCRNDLTRTVDPTSPGKGLMWREGGDAVGLYRLLERRVNGCPDPIVVNYRVPGSNALGRELGRDFEPPSSAAPRP